MNQKLSGAQLVLVPITKIGVNKFPFVENIRSRFIKFIDFYGVRYLPNSAEPGLQNTNNLFVTIMNKDGNREIIRNLPLARFNFVETLGVRQPIYSNISLSDCYINCQNASEVGKTAAFIFWYDLPEYSKANSTKQLVTDSMSVTLTTSVRYNKFPDEERMNGKRFRRLLLGTPSVTPDLQDGLSVGQLANIYVTLRKGSYNVLENMPVMMLYQLAMLQKAEFQNIIFDLQSSFLTIGGAGSIPNVDRDYIGKSVFFNMQYEK